MLMDVIKLLKDNISENSNVVLSCSGGPDSMCLFNLLLETKKIHPFNIICAHVNHNVRFESEEEQDFVTSFCKKNDVKIEILSITEYSGNFHNDARVLRYNFLKNLCKNYNASMLLTAHHGDDLVETILMRLSRGSSLVGYSGFQLLSKNEFYSIMRPLISYTKKEIVEYNDLNNFEYRIDKTNESLEYTRNKFRHIVLPSINEVDPYFNKGAVKFSKKIYEYDNFVKEYIESQNIIVDNQIDIILYLKESEFIRNRIIELLIVNLQKEHEFYVTENIIFEINKLILSNKGKTTINLPNGFLGFKENKKFYIKK